MVKLVADVVCKDLMGIWRAEFIDDIEEGGMARCIDRLSRFPSILLV